MNDLITLALSRAKGGRGFFGGFLKFQEEIGWMTKISEGRKGGCQFFLDAIERFKSICNIINKLLRSQVKILIFQFRKRRFSYQCTELQCLLLCTVTSFIYIIITFTFILLLLITSQIVFILEIFIIIVIIIIVIITIIIKINPPFSLQLTFKACKVMIKSSASMLARLKLTSSSEGM